MVLCSYTYLQIIACLGDNAQFIGHFFELIKYRIRKSIENSL
jgi:hypothetical protein